MSDREPTAVAIIGAGKAGTAIARLSLAAGHSVSLARSGAVDELAMMVEFTAPGAVAGSTVEAIRAAGLVVLSVPLARFRELPVQELAGKVVVDAMNYWPPVDGIIQDFEGHVTSSEVVQRFLVGARLVKTLNHIGYAELERDARPASDGERRAIAVASDDEDARSLVARYIDTLGYDPIELDTLELGRLVQPGGAFFGRSLDLSAAAELHELSASY